MENARILTKEIPHRMKNYMNAELNEANKSGGVFTDALKSWVMIVLTLLFVGLYASALVGWLRPLADVTMITRLEPIIFVIIGYYFGRLPAQVNERSLKEEIHRQTKNSEASLHAKEAAVKERDIVEEKVKNAKIALKIAPGESVRASGERETANGSLNVDSPQLLSSAVRTATQILDS